jgi:hypothetical protein
MTIFMFLYTNISRVPTDVSTSCSDASQWTEERDKKQTWQSVYSRKRDTKVENLSMIYENIFLSYKCIWKTKSDKNLYRINHVN